MPVSECGVAETVAKREEGRDAPGVVPAIAYEYTFFIVLYGVVACAYVGTLEVICSVSGRGTLDAGV